jgi:hypothetical protein
MWARFPGIRMRESGNIAFLRKKACAEGWEGGWEEKVASDSSTR